MKQKIKSLAFIALNVIAAVFILLGAWLAYQYFVRIENNISKINKAQTELSDKVNKLSHSIDYISDSVDDISSTVDDVSSSVSDTSSDVTDIKEQADASSFNNSGFGDLKDGLDNINNKLRQEQSDRDFQKLQDSIKAQREAILNN
jgi:methyl-accepting chemotaxis protein